MKPPKKSTVTVSYLMICVIISYSLGYGVNHYLDSDYREYMDRLKMYNKTYLENAKLCGVAYYDYGYCVWTKDTKEADWLKTDTHEQCHILVAKEYEHFCN